jgi:hypothetical protein
MPTAPAAPGQDIVAKASTEYRVKRLLMVVLLVGWGGWSLYDGYVKYPRDNARIAELRKEIEKLPPADEQRTKKEVELRQIKAYTDTDIFLNRLLGWTLPPLGLAMLVFALHNSRGEYRLRGETLSVPGHPPVPLSAMDSIDRTKWDRKGIAHVNYTLLNGTKGRLRLDDFIYEREPTDEIFKRIEVATGTGDAAAPAANRAESGS